MTSLIRPLTFSELQIATDGDAGPTADCFGEESKSARRNPSRNAGSAGRSGRKNKRRLKIN